MLGSAQRGIRGATPLNRNPAPKPAHEAPADAATSPPSPGLDHPGRTTSPDRLTGIEDLILGRLDDDKAQDVVFIDLKGKSPVADGLIVASGRSQRHVGAMADHLLRTLKEAGYGKCRVEGMPNADWVLIDAGDVIVHLFRPEVRSFYNIEKIWSVETGGHRAAV
ncbi:ribosome silencing factor [Phenylobacterium sp. SCN 70-31]|uniref:ribosome silencing factor n=1 Tax=Phenylobacterium sp. SCN 70-31 TaxID=1660129 RepID=UPI0025EEE7B0|nr:ribosome silencing factor [Phenylobacterium sp. SCN 70-31]